MIHITNRTLKGIYEYLMLEGVNSKGNLLNELKQFSSADLKGIEHELRVLMVKKVMEERKGE